jgi:hypothetical protein
MNKKQILKDLKTLIPIRAFFKEDKIKAFKHIHEVIGPNKKYNDRSICSLLSCVYLIIKDEEAKELLLEAMWMAIRMNRMLLENKKQSFLKGNTHKK